MTVRNYSVPRSANLQIDIAVAYANGDAIDLTTYTANGYYKPHVESANVSTFSMSGYSNGVLRAELTGVQTANVNLGRYMYEIYITHNTSNATSLVQEGLLTFNGGLG